MESPVFEAGLDGGDGDDQEQEDGAVDVDAQVRIILIDKHKKLNFKTVTIQSSDIFDCQECKCPSFRWHVPFKK